MGRLDDEKIHGRFAASSCLDALGTKLLEDRGIGAILADIDTVDRDIRHTNWVGELPVEVLRRRLEQSLGLGATEARLDLIEIKRGRVGSCAFLSLRLRGAGCRRIQACEIVNRTTMALAAKEVCLWIAIGLIHA